MKTHPYGIAQFIYPFIIDLIKRPLPLTLPVDISNKFSTEMKRSNVSRTPSWIFILLFLFLLLLPLRSSFSLSHLFSLFFHIFFCCSFSALFSIRFFSSRISLLIGIHRELQLSLWEKMIKFKGNIGNGGVQLSNIGNHMPRKHVCRTSLMPVIVAVFLKLT